MQTDYYYANTETIAIDENKNLQLALAPLDTKEVVFQQSIAWSLLFTS